MGDDLPEYDPGDNIRIDGHVYEVFGVDPKRDGIRSYHLESGNGERVRLEPYGSEGQFTLIRVRGVDPDDIDVLEPTAEEVDDRGNA